MMPSVYFYSTCGAHMISVAEKALDWDFGDEGSALAFAATW